MVPSQALVVSQFVLMYRFGLINSWGGIILPQLIVPVVVIVYKQFFDSVPKELREAAKLDGCGDFQILFRLYLPLNWGITTALAIITYIMAQNLQGDTGRHPGGAYGADELQGSARPGCREDQGGSRLSPRRLTAGGIHGRVVATDPPSIFSRERRSPASAGVAAA